MSSIIKFNDGLYFQRVLINPIAKLVTTCADEAFHYPNEELALRDMTTCNVDPQQYTLIERNPTVHIGGFDWNDESIEQCANDVARKCTEEGLVELSHEYNEYYCEMFFYSPNTNSFFMKFRHESGTGVWEVGFKVDPYVSGGYFGIHDIDPQAYLGDFSDQISYQRNIGEGCHILVEDTVLKYSNV